jgi:hypothetical protein
MDLAVPAAALALLSLGYLASKRRYWLWTDRILIPGCLAAFVFLVLPLSHADGVPESLPDLPPAVAGRLPSALQMLRAEAGYNEVRIGASPALEPIVNFYRAQHRVITWDRAGRDLISGSYDYFLLAGEDAGWVERRHLIVLYRDPGFLLARRSYDAM